MIDWILSLIGLVGIVIFILFAVIDLAKWVGRFRVPTPDVSADVRILMAEQLHVHEDPTAPETHYYGATNEAREAIQQQRRR